MRGGKDEEKKKQKVPPTAAALFGILFNTEDVSSRCYTPNCPLIDTTFTKAFCLYFTVSKLVRNEKPGILWYLSPQPEPCGGSTRNFVSV